MQSAMFYYSSPSHVPLPTPTPSSHSAAWSSYGASGSTPPQWVIHDVPSPSVYEIPHGVVYTSVSIPASGNASIGYSSTVVSAPSTPRRAEAPLRRLSWTSPSAPSPNVRILSPTRIPYSSGITRILSPPPSPLPPASAALPATPSAPGSDYVAELGRAAWKVMHAVAEQFPANPTHDEQQSALLFIYNFAKLYPCLKCRIHFQRVLQPFPPDVSSQAAFVAWMSAFHDRVNADLRKPQSA
jgi:hypothetical protein